jgi:signal peptidase I
VLVFSFVRVYQIEDISMHPALMDGDYVIVENISAGIQIPSLFGFFDTHLYHHPEGISRGDILAFKHPLDNRLYIKRCVALPGDSVMQKDKIFYLQIQSDENLTRNYAQRYALNTVILDGEFWIKAPYASYYTITHFEDISGPQFLFEYPKTRISEQHYFMLGDLRDNSTDSRFFHAVPYDAIYYKLWFCLAPRRNLKELSGIKFYDVI